MNKTALVLFAATAGVLSAQAPQPDPAPKPRAMTWEHKIAVAGAPQEATFGFIAAEGAAGFAGTPIKGAPYTATVEHSFTQTLADGTRIQRKSSSKTARDSEGRTRTEHSPAAIGPVPVDLPTTVFIHDPVAKQTIVLNEKEKTARVMKMPDMEAMKAKMATAGATAGVRMRTPAPTIAATGPSHQDVRIERHVEIRSAGEGAPGDVLFEHAIPVPPPGTGVNQQVVIFRTNDDKSKSESLGTQTISGVPCKATRNTHTIPASQIGNDRPIDIVTETCFSDELKTLVSSRTNDPMHGESTMRLSEVSRSEPAKSLFEIPAGYATKEGSQPMMFERKIERK